MKFGWLLRQTRKGVGLTQEAMAEEIHIARSTISKLERDEMTLSAEDLVRWLQIIKEQMIKNRMRLGMQSTTSLEIGAAIAPIVQGVDLIALTDMLTRIVGGFINLGGLL